MTVWATTSVSQVPELSLERWCIYEVQPGPTYHLVGVNVTEGREGRVSSPVRSFDRETMTATTFSGRKYRLLGSPGHSMDAMYVWSRWKEINRGTDEKEVDVDYLCSKIGIQQEEK